MIDTPEQALREHLNDVYNEYEITCDGSCWVWAKSPNGHHDAYYVQHIDNLTIKDMPVRHARWGWASKLMFNCSSKWLSEYIGVDFRVLEVLKDFLNLTRYTNLLERLANWKLRGGFTELVGAAVDYYGLDYFKVDVYGRFLVYKINTKVEY